MENEKYVTVIPVEYPRSSKQYSQPLYHYQDYSSNIPSSTSSQYISHEQQCAGLKNRIFVSSDTDSPGVKETVESRCDNQSRDCSQNLLVCIYLMNNVVLHLELEDGMNTTVTDLINCIIKLEELMLPDCAKLIFTLWMNSGLLEVQLKPHHKPLLVRSKWNTLLSRFAHASAARQLRDEPILSFQRNVFYPLNEEQRLGDLKTLELLYEEAKYNILEGRYPCDISQYTMLGGIQARLELGSYNPQIHTNKFFRSQKNRFLPLHARHDPITSWFRSRIKNTPEVRLLEHYKRIPSSASDQILQRRYLEVCWSFPFYGCAFFQGQIEEPVRGLTSLLLHQDLPVLVGVNERGLYVIDNNDAKLILGLGYEEFSWECGQPSKPSADSLPCMFLQFAVIENGARVSKIMQIFSKQCDMIDALMTTFANEIEKKLQSEPADATDGSKSSDLSNYHSSDIQLCKLSNKLSKLTLATFDDEVGPS